MVDCLEDDNDIAGSRVHGAECMEHGAWSMVHGAWSREQRAESRERGETS